MEQESRELVIRSVDCCNGFVEISRNDTLADLRTKIASDFDDDMIPEQPYCFVVQGIRYSSKQETRKRAWDLQDVAIQPCHKKARITSCTTSMNGMTAVPSSTPLRGEGAQIFVSHEKGVGNSNNNKSAALESSSPMPLTVLEKNLLNNAEDETENETLSDKPVAEKAAEPDEKTVGAEAQEQEDDKSLEDEDLYNAPEEMDHSTLDNSTSENESTEDVVSEIDESLETALVTPKQDPEDVSDTPKVDTTGAVDTLLEEEEEEDNEEPIEVDDRKTAPTENEPENPHVAHDTAIGQSKQVLRDLDQVLKENPLFCSEERRADWTDEIRENLNRSDPNTVIGVLGNTGVGKSSLLNALLDEASVLPTSGSRGCTAAVVELRFNKELQTMTDTDTIWAYKGEVEFIRLEEWTSELNLLVTECSTAEKSIYARRPESDNMPDAAAAWAKIDQVYGKGTMDRFTGRKTEWVYNNLASDRRVRQLLTPTEGKDYHSIMVNEGSVDATKAKSICTGFAQIGTRLRREKKKWAQSFRSKINDYVYRKGDGSQPQTWPLIRKVVLHGPWPVLCSGACLVDLPGVRDANAARARVSEKYLQNCNLIWVVAPIKRAVDDGTAKELLGEQFKRRLLMDGQYGNVSFICTQTDDCEATEIMRDHSDVAMTVEGRWETMTSLRSQISEIETKLTDAQQTDEELRADYEEAKEGMKEIEEELGILNDDSEDVNTELMTELVASKNEKSKLISACLRRLRDWKKSNKPILDRLHIKCESRQRRLKALCATVRNEYSKGCLQADFKAGLKELVASSEEEASAPRTNPAPDLAPIPDDFEMDVFCISANDYLKVQGIKASSDGRPNTFASANDTQIPSLRQFVHEKTAQLRKHFTEEFVNAASDMIDRVKLLASDAKNIPSGRQSRRSKAIFEIEMNKLDKKLFEIGGEFCKKAGVTVNTSLGPSLKTGAVKGRQAAVSTVISWGSKNRRRRNEKLPGMTGLYWSTYNATVRRNGVYTSPSAGAIDMNQELCDPMEKEYGANWQATMDASIRVYLRQAEGQCLKLASDVDRGIVNALKQAGVAADRLVTMSTTGTRSAQTVVKQAFRDITGYATDQQRELNRSLKPLVESRMTEGYSRTTNVPGGTGKFMRMKDALETHARCSVDSLFDESSQTILKAINEMVGLIGQKIRKIGIAKTMEQVYSTLWDDHEDRSAQVDPVQREKVQQCRDRLLPVLNKLRQLQDSTMRTLGIERDEPELDVMAVASLDTRLETSYNQAVANNEVIDLCDSDAEPEIEIPLKPSALAQALAKVKSEPDYCEML